MIAKGRKLFLRRFCLLAIFILLVGCSKESDQELWDKLNIAMEQERDDLQIDTLEIIEELVKRNNNQIKQPDFMDRFTTIVLGNIDLDANWLSVNNKKDDRAPVIGKILNRMDSSVLLTSLGKKIIETQSRKKSLALS